MKKCHVETIRELTLLDASKIIWLCKQNTWSQIQIYNKDIINSPLKRKKKGKIILLFIPFLDTQNLLSSYQLKPVIFSEFPK